MLPLLRGTAVSSRDADYYRARAIEERGLAEAVDRADVAAIHLELAKQYDALADQESLRPVFGKATPDEPST